MNVPAASVAPAPPPVAVVLAAGLGSRLRAVHAERPKGFLEIGGEPIIARSLRTLARAGIRDVVFVVGWRAEHYRTWCAATLPQARCVDNPDYATTGSLRSLLLGAAAFPGRDLLVVESDLLYEPRAATALLAAPSHDTILVSGFTQSRDEVWVYQRAPGLLGHLTKAAPTDPRPLGELVGLSRLSHDLVAALQAAARDLPAPAHYEDGLNALAPSRPISLLHVTDLAWCEIDDAEHLERARHTIWPRIQSAMTAVP